MARELKAQMAAEMSDCNCSPLTEQGTINLILKTIYSVRRLRASLC